MSLTTATLVSGLVLIVLGLPLLLNHGGYAAMLKSMPDDFGTEVHAVKAYADFMGRTGGLKNVPASWSDVFPAILEQGGKLHGEVLDWLLAHPK